MKCESPADNCCASLRPTSDPVLSLVVARRHVLNNLPLSLTSGPPILLVKVGIGFILLLFSKEVIFLVRVKIPGKKIEISILLSL